LPLDKYGYLGTEHQDVGNLDVSDKDVSDKKGQH